MSKTPLTLYLYCLFQSVLSLTGTDKCRAIIICFCCGYSGFFFLITVLLPFYHADSRTLWLFVWNRKTVKWALIIHTSRIVSGPRCSVGGFYTKGKCEHQP